MIRRSRAIDGSSSTGSAGCQSSNSAASLVGFTALRRFAIFRMLFFVCPHDIFVARPDDFRACIKIVSSCRHGCAGNRAVHRKRLRIGAGVMRDSSSRIQPLARACAGAHCTICSPMPRLRAMFRDTDVLDQAARGACELGPGQERRAAGSRPPPPRYPRRPQAGCSDRDRASVP